MTEYDLQYVIIQNWHTTNNLLVPNIEGGYGEMDVLRLTKSGYAYEYEVKISNADFNADKKKEVKHRSYQTVFENKPLLNYFGQPKSKKGIPNYFIYVAPKGVLLADKIPKYAGFYEVGDGHIRCTIDAPKIHSEKFQDYWKAKVLYSLHTKYLYHYWFKLKPVP
jgi:hypothetical protein